MSKESFSRGFCKVAAAHGVDPVALAKYAADNADLSDFAKWMDSMPAADIRTKPSGAEPKMTFGDVRRLNPEAHELDGDPVMSGLRSNLRGLHAEDARLDEELTDERLKAFATWLKSRPAARINTGRNTSEARAPEAWNPLGPEGYVGGNSVTNNTGIYHLPAPIGGSGWGARTAPLNMFGPGDKITRMPSQAAATNSPSAKYTVLTHGTKKDVPIWKRVRRSDGTVANVPSSMDALINLQNLIGVK